MTAQDHVESLNDLSANVARHLRHRVELIGDGLLRFVYDKPRQSREVMEIPLLSLQSTSKTNAQPRLITVAVQAPAASGDPASASARDVFETKRWHETVAFQSHLTQLRRLCAESLERLENQDSPDSLASLSEDSPV